MGMPTAEDSPRLAEMFADIVCSETDWMDAEFEAIVAEFWQTPQTVIAPPRAPLSPARRPEERRAAHTAAAREALPPSPISRVRSPP